jgi:hypothetical protein
MYDHNGLFDGNQTTVIKTRLSAEPVISTLLFRNSDAAWIPEGVTDSYIPKTRPIIEEKKNTAS